MTDPNFTVLASDRVRLPVHAVRQWAVFGLLTLAVMYGAYLYCDGITDTIDNELPLETAKLVRGVCASVGVEFPIRGTILSPAMRPFQITRKCTGLDGVLITVAVMLPAPLSRSWRVLGIAMSVPIVFVVNTARLVSLALLGEYTKRGAEVADNVIWPTVYAGIWLLIFVWWYRAGMRRLSLRGTSLGTLRAGSK